MDEIQDFEIRDESTDDRIQYTLYNKGLARLRLEEWRGSLFVQQIMIGPISVDEFKVIAHGLTEFLLVIEGVENAYKKKKSPKKKRERNKRRQRA